MFEYKHILYTDIDTIWPIYFISYWIISLTICYHTDIRATSEDNLGTSTLTKTLSVIQ